MTTTVKCEIAKITTGHAYARNGNAHNPTPHTAWTVTYKGRLVGIVSKFSTAKNLARDFEAAPEW